MFAICEFQSRDMDKSATENVKIDSNINFFFSKKNKKMRQMFPLETMLCKKNVNTYFKKLIHIF